MMRVPAPPGTVIYHTMSSVKGTPDHRYTFAYILNKPHATCLPTRMPVPLLSKDAIGTSNLARRRHQRAMRLQQDVR